MYASGWGGCRTAMVELLAVLVSQNEIEQIVGDTGPQLAASSLHPLVWTAAARLWDDGHHREAVQTAAQALEGLLQGVLGKPDVGGTDLALGFSTKPPDAKWPRLRIPGLDQASRTWTTAHEGAGYLVRSAFQYVRNLSSHPGAPPLTDEEALEQLAVLSMAARLVERCELVKAEA
jgi:hypothetical protein